MIGFRVSIASKNKFRIVAQRTSFDLTYPRPWEVEECETVDEAIEKTDLQNNGLKLFELNNGDYIPPNFKMYQAFYVYNDQGKLIRKPEDVYPDFVPLGV